MKSKFLAFLLAACLLVPSIPVEAAASFNKAGDNYKWTGISETITITKGGTYTFTVAGSEGGTYNGTTNKGDIVTYSARLEDGDTVTIKTGAKPSNYSTVVDYTNTAGATVNQINVNAGVDSVLYINGVETVRAIGGSATTRSYAQENVSAVNLFNSKGEAAAFLPHIHNDGELCQSEGTPAPIPCTCAVIKHVDTAFVRALNTNNNSFDSMLINLSLPTSLSTTFTQQTESIMSQFKNAVRNKSNWSSYNTFMLSGDAYLYCKHSNTYLGTKSFASTWSNSDSGTLQYNFTHYCDQCVSSTLSGTLTCSIADYALSPTPLSAPANASVVPTGGTLQAGANAGSGYINMVCSNVDVIYNSLTMPNYLATLTGNYSFTVPFSGWYQVTIAGSAGNTQGGSARSAGESLTKKMWLTAGTVLSGTVGKIPGNYWDGNVYCVNGGVSTTLKVDGTLYAKAIGGAGTTGGIAPSGATHVRVYSSDKVNSAQGAVHWHTGSVSTTSNGCYNMPYWYYSYEVNGSHSLGSTHYHGDTVNPDHQPDACRQCKHCGGHSSDGETDGKCSSNKETKTGYVESRTTPKGGISIKEYHLGCGYAQGQILNVPTIGRGSSTNSNGMTSGSNTGNGYFKIQLCEQQNLYYTQTSAKKVSLAAYDSRKYNVVVNNNVVVYCKHGNLN